MSKTRPVKVAMIGVGAISGIYLKNIIHTFREVELIGVCDLIPERAENGVAYIKEEQKRREGCDSEEFMPICTRHLTILTSKLSSI